MNEKKSLGGVLFNGIVTENPTFRLVLGMCPTLAISTAVTQGIGMGLATTFVLVFSNLVISLLRNIIPEKVRIPSFVVVIATFVTVVDLMMKAYVPSLSQSLGVYIPLIVVNCIIFARAESYAFKNPPMASLMDGLGMCWQIIRFTLKSLFGFVWFTDCVGLLYAANLPKPTQTGMFWILPKTV